MIPRKVLDALMPLGMNVFSCLLEGNLGVRAEFPAMLLEFTRRGHHLDLA